MLGHGLAALRRRPLLGAAVSVAFHAALVAALLWVHPASPPKQKRGDALIVELRDLNEPAARGTPGPTPGASPVPAEPAPKAPPVPKGPLVRPAPPAPSRPPAVAQPVPKAEPREAPRAIASASQPPPVERGDVPTAKAAPQSTPARPEPPAAPPVASVPPGPPGQVAMVPPPVDIRSALRRGGGGGGTGPGGAGGSGTGRGGILGEPIPLDSKDPDFTDYLERVRRLIKQNWGYPCVKNAETRECEYKSTRLVVEFGILRQGPVQFVEIRHPSGWLIYDDYAVNAIKLASPFPPVPAALMARMERGSAGLPIRVNFTYLLETGVTNVLR